MKRWIIALSLVFIFLVPGTVFAQNPIEFENVEVDLWPEYDRQDMLVIYRMSLSQKTNLPAKMSIRVPGRVGKPYNLAMRDADGLLYNLDYTLRPDGDWTWIDFTTTSPNIQLEYYDPNLIHNQEHRSYHYSWPGDYPVSTMNVEVQQPANARNMKITPDMGSSRTDQNGQIYFTSLIGAMKSNASFNVDIQYDKSDNTVRFTPIPVQAPTLENISGHTNFMVFLPWLLGGLGFILIIGGVLWYWQAGRENVRIIRRRHPASTKPISNSRKSQEVYCHQCGKRAEPGDDFCRMCGTRLRAE
jgi:hypothetical protein